MKYLLILMLIVTMASCGNDGNRKNDTSPPPPPPAKELSISDLKKERDAMSVKLIELNSIIKLKQEERMVTWATYIGYACIALSFILGISAFVLRGYPFMPRICGYASAIVAGLSFMCFAFVPLIPYLTVISIGIFFMLCIVGVWYWHRDRQALTCVVAGVNEMKQHVSQYKPILQRHVTGKVDKWVDAVRKNAR